MITYILLTLFLSILQNTIGAKAYVQDVAYDAGAYGNHPVQSYVSTDITSPHLNVLKWDHACDDGLHTMLTPRGGGVKEAGAMIMNSRGDLVWWMGGYNQIYNLQAQVWEGKSYLTFWAGNDAVGGHGAGHYYMLDNTYTEIFKISAANGLAGDLHDFKFTPQGTALITVYQAITTDLTDLGKSSLGVIWDCLIQEISLSDQSLLFQWRASKHYNVSETFRTIGDDGTASRAFDFFHINSVDKDEDGNYLISSRYMHTITYIDGQTGDIIWVLGGKRNMFTDLSGGKATSFRFQHDARWQGKDEITLFDNAAEDGHKVGEYTRGIRLQLNTTAMTVRLVTEYINPNRIFGISQGNMHVMETGDVVLGYGNSAAWTQFDRNGTVLCDVHFGPMSQFSWGMVQSYRVFKFAWHGYPSTSPDVRLNTDEERNMTAVFVSWNGDTEVVKWVLQHSDVQGTDSKWINVKTMARMGFETKIETVIQYGYLRVYGINRHGEKIGYSDGYKPIDEGFWRTLFLGANPKFNPQISIIPRAALAFFAALLLFYTLRGVLSLRSRASRWKYISLSLGREE